MKDDVLLRQLGQVAREQMAAGEPFLDERWDRLAAGTLSSEEDAELRRLAETSEEAREAYEAFRPLGPEFHSRVVRALAAHPPMRFPTRLRRFTRWAAAAGLAAALVPIVPRVAPPLPGYTLAALGGGSRATRGELIEVPQFAPGDSFETVLRPQTSVGWGWLLRAEAFLRREGELQRVEVASDRAPSGVVTVTGSLAPDVPTGDWTLWLVVGRPGTLPAPEEIPVSAVVPIQERNWVAVPTPLRIEPRPPG